jgi:hypothetical protein
MFERTLAISLVMILMLGVTKDGSAQPIADKPDFRPGDSWEFLAKEAKRGKSTVWTRAIEAIESPERIAVKQHPGTTAYYDSALNPLLWGRSDWARLLVRYPLHVGDEWTFSINFTNPYYGEIGRGKVIAYESLQVPAGTFQCYRVEAESTYGSKYYTEYRVWIRWYCPEIKWLAKDILMTRTHNVANPAGNDETTVTSVLVKFKPGS